MVLITERTAINKAQSIVCEMNANMSSIIVIFLFDKTVQFNMDQMN